MKKFMVLSMLLCVSALIGCGGKSEDTKGEMKTTAPVNNDSPAAKNAGAAPRNEGIIMPGEVKGKK